MTSRTRKQGASTGSAAPSPPPYYYSSMPVSRHSETTPLIGKEKHWKEWLLGVTVVIGFVLISMVIVDFSIRATRQPCNDPLDPDVRDRIRKKWDHELQQHNELVLNHQKQEATWEREQTDHDELIEEWNREREGYMVEKQEREEKWKVEQITHDELIEEWMGEKKEREERWKVEQIAHDELIEEWNREREGYMAEKWEREQRWKREQKAHDELVREQWERERIDHDREKMEREQREEDERRRLNMFWVDVEPRGCTTYATREYIARLANVPSNYDRRVEACKATPLVVHDQSYLPSTCEDNGSNGTIGTWKVNHNQPDCVTSWTDYKVKGCTSVGSGRRYIEHRLDNLQPGGNWREFSATTPVRFHGMQFSGAEESFQSAWGVYGLWKINDDEC